MAVKCTGIDDRVLGITPNLAVEWGYNLYLVDSLPEGSHVRANAGKAIEELDRLFETFPHASRERCYITTLRLAANSFARGLERRKSMRAARLVAAKEEKDHLVRKYANSEKLGGFLTASFKPLLAGGAVWALVQALLLIPVVQSRASGNTDVQYVSLAFALFTTLISAWFKGWLTGKRLVSLFNRYDEALRKAQEIYASEVVGEYKLTADSARSAWQHLTGQEPPADSKVFDTVLVGLMTSHDHHPVVALNDIPKAQA